MSIAGATHGVRHVNATPSKGAIAHLSIPPRRPSNRGAAPPQKEEGHRINNRIDAREVRLIGVDGQNVGVVPLRQALMMAEDANLDPEFSEKFLRFVIQEVIRHHEQALENNGG